MASPVEIVQSIYQAFVRRDVAHAVSQLSADVVLVQSEELPWGGTYRGAEGVRQFFGRLTGHLNSTLEIERTLSAGAHVVVMGWTKGNVVSTGAPYRVPFAHVWKIAGSQVVEMRFFIDHPTMSAALQA